LNSLSYNQAGILLLKYINFKYDISMVASYSPIRYSGNKNHQTDIIDIAIMKTGSLNYHLTNFSEEISDHTPSQLDI